VLSSLSGVPLRNVAPTDKYDFAFWRRLR